MTDLIVNADDFGQARCINDAVIRAHKTGILTSTTLMANGEAFDHAVALARENTDLGVGVHLNLVEGAPVAASDQVRSLLHDSGHFVPKYSLLRRHLIGRLDLGELKKEVAAQIDSVINAGLSPTHIDAHKNIHAYPAFFGPIVETAASRGIRAIRLPLERIRFRDLLCSPSSLVRTTLLNGAAWWCRRLLTDKIRTTSRFAGTLRTGTLDAEWLLNWLPTISESVELMTHPAIYDEELETLNTRLTKQREIELSALTDPRVVEKVSDLAIRLIHFGQLTPRDSVAHELIR